MSEDKDMADGPGAGLQDSKAFATEKYLNEIMFNNSEEQEGPLKKDEFIKFLNKTYAGMPESRDEDIQSARQDNLISNIFFELILEAKMHDFEEETDTDPKTKKDPVLALSKQDILNFINMSDEDIIAKSEEFEKKKIVDKAAQNELWKVKAEKEREEAKLREEQEEQEQQQYDLVDVPGGGLGEEVYGPGDSIMD